MKQLHPADLEHLDRASLLSDVDVRNFLEDNLPDHFDIGVVPYSAEDAMARPRVMMNHGASYCSLELPLSPADALYYATLLVVFGKE